MADLIDLLMAPTDATAAEKAAAVIDRLRGQRQVAMAMGLARDPGVAHVGGGLAAEAQAAEGNVLKGMTGRFDRALTARKQAEEERSNRAQEYLRNKAIELGKVNVVQNQGTGVITAYDVHTGKMLWQDKEPIQPKTGGAGGGGSKMVEDQVRRLSEKLGPVGELGKSWARLEDLISGTKPIKGFGLIQGNYPDAVVTDPESIANRQDVARLSNILLKVRSGTAVTPHEEVRYRRESGTHLMSPDPAVRAGLKKAREDAIAKVNATAAGYPPLVRAVYAKRLGQYASLFPGLTEGIPPEILNDPQLEAYARAGAVGPVIGGGGEIGAAPVGAAPMGAAPVGAAPAAAGGAAPAVKLPANKAEAAKIYQKLPSGTPFITPDGQQGIKR